MIDELVRWIRRNIAGMTSKHWLEGDRLLGLLDVCSFRMRRVIHEAWSSQNASEMSWPSWYANKKLSNSGLSERKTTSCPTWTFFSKVGYSHLGWFYLYFFDALLSWRSCLLKVWIWMAARSGRRHCGICRQIGISLGRTGSFSTQPKTSLAQPLHCEETKVWSLPLLCCVAALLLTILPFIIPLFGFLRCDFGPTSLVSSNDEDSTTTNCCI